MKKFYKDSSSDTPNNGVGDIKNIMAMLSGMQNAVGNNGSNINAELVSRLLGGLPLYGNNDSTGAATWNTQNMDNSSTGESDASQNASAKQAENATTKLGGSDGDNTLSRHALHYAASMAQHDAMVRRIHENNKK